MYITSKQTFQAETVMSDYFENFHIPVISIIFIEDVWMLYKYLYVIEI